MNNILFDCESWQMALKLFKKSKKTQSGFDISAEGITGVLIEMRKEETHLLNSSFEPFKEEVVQNGVIVKPEIFAETLSKFSANHNFNAEMLSIAVPGNLAFIKTITLPNLPADELSIIVPQEATKHLPFQLNEVNLDFEILKYTKKQELSKEVDVLFAAMTKSIVKSYTDLFYNAGFMPTAVEIAPFSVIRTLANAQYIDDSDSLYISVLSGFENTDINIICHGMPVFSYNISAGKKSVIDAIATSLEIDFSKAKELLKETEIIIPGMEMNVDPYLSRASNAARIVYNNLSGEIMKIIEFYNSQTAEQKEISRIILSGSGICVQNIDKYISNRLKIETVVCNSLNNIHPDITLSDDLLHSINIPALAAGIGAP